jgi:hypothetical protein
VQWTLTVWPGEGLGPCPALRISFSTPISLFFCCLCRLSLCSSVETFFLLLSLSQELQNCSQQQNFFIHKKKGFRV